jgi:hypothetical protein
MFWMLAGYDDYVRAYYKDYDHFSVYSPKVDVTGKAMQEFGGRMGAKAQACERAAAEPRLLEPRRQVPAGFVTTSKPDIVIRLNANVAEAAAETAASPLSDAGAPSPKTPRPASDGKGRTK